MDYKMGVRESAGPCTHARRGDLPDLSASHLLFDLAPSISPISPHPQGAQRVSNALPPLGARAWLPPFPRRRPFPGSPPRPRPRAARPHGVRQHAPMESRRPASRLRRRRPYSEGVAIPRRCAALYATHRAHREHLLRRNAPWLRLLAWRGGTRCHAGELRGGW